MRAALAGGGEPRPPPDERARRGGARASPSSATTTSTCPSTARRRPRALRHRARRARRARLRRPPARGGRAARAATTTSARRTQDAFRYVLVDEYQDTNVAQERLLELLAGEHRNVFCVADEDQSIYGFRGRRDREHARLRGALARRDTLRPADELPLGAGDRRARDERHPPQRRHAPRQAARARPRTARRELVGRTFRHAAEEADWIAREIAGAAPRRSVQLGEIAVLARSLKAGRAAARLRAPPPRDPVPRAARAAAPPDRRRAPRRCSSSPPPTVGASTRRRRAAHARLAALRRRPARAAPLPPRPRARSTARCATPAASTRSSRRSRSSSGSAPPAPRSTRSGSGSTTSASSRCCRPRRASEIEELAAVTALSDAANEFEGAPGDVRRRLPRAASSTTRSGCRQRPLPADAVALLTVHQAKGLEWDAVFVCDLVEGRFPALARSQYALFDRDDFAAAPARRGRARPPRARGGAAPLLRRAHARPHAALPDRDRGGARGGRPLALALLPRGAAVPRRAPAAHDGFVSSEEALAALRRAGGGPPAGATRRDGERESDAPDGGLWTSASRLAPYENCPLQFFFGSLLEIGGTRTTAMQLGGVFHDVLEAFHDPERSRAADARAPARARRASSWATTDIRPARARGRAPAHARHDAAQLLRVTRSRRASTARCSRSSGASVRARRLDGHRLHRPDRPAADGRPAPARLQDLAIGDDRWTRPSRTSSSPSTRSPAARCPSSPSSASVAELVYLYPTARRLRAADAPRPDRHAGPRRPDTRARVLGERRAIVAEEFDFSPEADCQWCEFKRICPRHHGARRAAVILTDEQRRDPRHERGPLRIAAGAGTGKTDTLRRAIVELIERRRSPGEILCLTFTVEATKEMRRRVLDAFADRDGHRSRRADRPDLPRLRRLDRARARAPRSGSTATRRCSTARARGSSRSRRSTAAASTSLEIGWLPSSSARCSTLNEEMQRHVVSPDEVRAWCRAHRADDEVARQRLEALQAVEAYRALKRERNAIDFGDQIALAVELLRDAARGARAARARASATSSSTSTRTPTSPSASSSSSSAAAPSSSAPSATWTRASSAGAARRSTTCSRSPTTSRAPRLETLSVNFRSGQRILDLANAVDRRVASARARSSAQPLRPSRRTPRRRPSRRSSRRTSSTRPTRSRARIADGGEPVVAVRRADATRERSSTRSSARSPPAASRSRSTSLGGFWTRPEILDVLAWLRVLADPGDNLALARLLLGPAYRLSRRDLFFLADGPKDENRRLRYGDRDVLPYALADSIVAHAEIAELSGRGARADHGVPRDLARARRDRDARLARRPRRRDRARLRPRGRARRVARPRGGARAAPPREAARPRAGLPAGRGLARPRRLRRLPRLARGVRAGRGRAPRDRGERRPADDPPPREGPRVGRRLPRRGSPKGRCRIEARAATTRAERWERLPFELRGDRDFLPPAPTTKADLDQLRDEEERRLDVRRHHPRQTPARPLARLVLPATTSSRKRRRPSGTSRRYRARRPCRELDCPQENPHPLGAEPPTRDQAALRAPLHRIQARSRGSSPSWSGCARSKRSKRRYRRGARRRRLSVTAFLTFVRDPEEFFWRYVRRTPSPPSPAAQLGTELHRRIEEHARGRVAARRRRRTDAEEPYDLDLGERRGGAKPVTADELWENFERSRFASMTPLMVEQPFTLYIGEGLSVEGRIDAIFEREDGVWEVVDYKTGASDPDPLQLAIYARARRGDLGEAGGNRMAATAHRNRASGAGRR